MSAKLLVSTRDTNDSARPTMIITEERNEKKKTKTRTKNENRLAAHAAETDDDLR